ncbi:hypothetical protein GCM10027610_024620 [Dactylosporangium cerinum]
MLADSVVAALGVKFAAMLPHLDERQRRLYLAVEADTLGHGGIAAVVAAAGYHGRLSRVDGVKLLVVPQYSGGCVVAAADANQPPNGTLAWCRR